MAFTAGDITEITCTHPTLGNFTFQVKKGVEATYDLGGVKTQDDDEGITGSGEPIYDMQNSRWFVEMDSVAWDMNTRDELSSLKLLSSAAEEGNWTFNCINGDVRGGSGKPVGDIQGTNKSNMSIKIAGGDGLEKIG